MAAEEPELTATAGENWNNRVQCPYCRCLYNHHQGHPDGECRRPERKGGADAYASPQGGPARAERTADRAAEEPELVHFQAWAVLIRDSISGNMAWMKLPELHANREGALAELHRHAADYAASGFEYYLVPCEIDAELVHSAKRPEK